MWPRNLDNEDEVNKWIRGSGDADVQKNRSYFMGEKQLSNTEVIERQIIKRELLTEIK